MANALAYLLYIVASASSHPFPFHFYLGRWGRYKALLIQPAISFNGLSIGVMLAWKELQYSGPYYLQAVDNRR